VSRRSRRAGRSAKQKYTSCCARYFDPQEPSQIVAMSMAIVDLATDKMVEYMWYDESDECEPEEAASRAVDLASKYGVPVHLVSEPVPLQRCQCGVHAGRGLDPTPCPGYLVRTITSRNLHDIGAA
jgi:hypothetical protein